MRQPVRVVGRQSFFNDPSDVQWLKDTHLRGKKNVPVFRSFVLHGNEDAPEYVALYAKRQPNMEDDVVGELWRDNLVVENPMSSRNPKRKKKPPHRPAERWAPKMTHPFHIEKWEERDRVHIALMDAENRTIIEWWDDDAREAVVDGFLNPRDLLGSATAYAKDMGIL